MWRHLLRRWPNQINTPKYKCHTTPCIDEHKSNTVHSKEFGKSKIIDTSKLHQQWLMSDDAKALTFHDAKFQLTTVYPKWWVQNKKSMTIWEIVDSSRHLLCYDQRCVRLNSRRWLHILKTLMVGKICGKANEKEKAHHSKVGIFLDYSTSLCTERSLYASQKEEGSFKVDILVSFWI